MFKSPIFRVALSLLAALAFIILMSPILRYPIGGDDLYWVLLQPSNYHNSFWETTLQWLGHAYDFSSNQARTVALQGVERVSLAIVVMKLATFFSVSPTLIWALFKLIWVGVVMFSVWLFLSVFRYRSATGEVLQLAFKTRAIISTLFPLLAVTGFEVATVGYSNGWIFYPNLTYLPVAYYLLIAVFLLQAERALQSNFKLWIVPISLALILIGWGLNLSYEINALSVPFAIAVLLLKPVVKKKEFLNGQKNKWLISTIFGGAYAVIFLWTRWQLAHMPCVATHTCYSGTVVNIQLGTIVKNFISALPGSDIPWLINAPRGTISLSVVLVGLIAATVMGYSATRFVKRLDVTGANGVIKKENEQRPLLVIAALMVFVALGSAVITGITERAVSRLETPVTPYRSGPIITFALSVAVAAMLVLLWRRLAKRTTLRKTLTLGFAGLCVALATVNFVINMSFMHKAISTPSSAFVNQIYDEVSLGAKGEISDHRRCSLLEEYNVSTKSTNKEKVIRGAQDAFKLYYGVPFCTKEIKAIVDMNNLDGY